MNAVIEGLLRDRRLEAREADDDEVVGFWQKAEHAHRDACNVSNSLDGRFDRAYTAARITAVAVLRDAGFRVRGEAHHFVAFHAARHLVEDVDLQQAFAAAEAMRALRHEVDYGYESTLSLQDVEAAVDLVERLFDRGARHLRARRPSAKQRIRIVRPRGRRDADERDESVEGG
jgi:uncharacterized protein (UPF0332 family)